MKVIDMKKGLAKDGETCFTEVGIQNDGGMFWVFCIEADELRILVRSETPMLELAEGMGFTGGMEYDTVTAFTDRQESELNENSCDFYEMVAFCMESEMEHYECWKHDGGEGIYDAADSEYGIAFIIAYGLMDRAFYPNSSFCASLQSALNDAEEINAAEVEALISQLTEKK